MGHISMKDLSGLPNGQKNITGNISGRWSQKSYPNKPTQGMSHRIYTICPGSSDSFNI